MLVFELTTSWTWIFYHKHKTSRVFLRTKRSTMFVWSNPGDDYDKTRVAIRRNFLTFSEFEIQMMRFFSWNLRFRTFNFGRFSNPLGKCKHANNCMHYRKSFLGMRSFSASFSLLTSLVQVTRSINIAEERIWTRALEVRKSPRCQLSHNPFYTFSTTIE